MEMESNARITDFLFNKASGRKIPLNGTFELSPECNFACRMCYVRKTHREILTHDRPMVTLEQWLGIARQAREQGLLYLLLTGGEPFLWPDFWKLYDALIHMGFLVSINTNGSLIDDEAIRKLQELPPTRVNITLYGASDATYERLCGAKGVFSRVDGAIGGLKAAGVPVKLNCSLTPYNACDLEAITRYAQEKDIYLQVNTYMFPPIRRDASMVGENDRFTPHEAAYYHMKRYQLQTTPEEYRSFLRQTAEGMEQPSAGRILHRPRGRQDSLPCGQRFLLDHMGRLDSALRHDARAEGGADGSPVFGRVEGACRYQRRPDAFRPVCPMP